MRNSIGIAMLTAAAFAGLPAAGQSEPLVDEYASGEFGRIRAAADGAMLLRTEASLSDVGDELLNAPVFPGDALETGSIQRVEVQLAGGSVIRVDRGSRVTFLSLPDPYAEIADNTVLQVARGRVALDVQLDRDGEFRVDTPAGSIFAMSHADIRLVVEEDGRTRVASRRGTVEVVGDGGSVILRGGTRTFVDPGATPLVPDFFNTFAAGGFDLWVEQREALYTERVDGVNDAVYAELPHEVRPYYRELSYHGRWVYTNDDGYLWAPRDRSSGWRPYYDGYWSYGPRGYFWVSHEPWGWAPYHYGRWSWVAGHGWCWSPGRVFGGAWVAWSWGSVYVGWSALDRWNRPIFHSPVLYGYYDPYAWTFVSYRHITHQGYPQYAVTLDQVGPHIHRAAVVTRPPKVAPSRLAASVDVRQRTLTDLHEDLNARVAPVSSRERPGGSTFIGGEDRWVRDGQRATTAGRLVSRSVAEDRQPVSRSSDRTNNSTLTPTRRTTLRGTTEPALSGSAAVVRERTSESRSVPAPERREATNARPQRSAPESRPRQVAPRSDSDGRRDVYRPMVQPPQTRSDGSARPEKTPARSTPAPQAVPRSESAPTQTRAVTRPRTASAPAEATRPSRVPVSRPLPKATAPEPRRPSGGKSGRSTRPRD